jgi:hypothetical protein
MAQVLANQDILVAKVHILIILNIINREETYALHYRIGGDADRVTRTIFHPVPDHECYL